ncbi:unnamed protein product, partial [Prorocentrum cordatum]
VVAQAAEQIGGDNAAEFAAATAAHHHEQLATEAGRIAEMDANVISHHAVEALRVRLPCHRRARQGAQAWCDGIAQQLARRDGEHTDTVKALQYHLRMVEQGR